MNIIDSQGNSDLLTFSLMAHRGSQTAFECVGVAIGWSPQRRGTLWWNRSGTLTPIPSHASIATIGAYTEERVMGTSAPLPPIHSYHFWPPGAVAVGASYSRTESCSIFCLWTGPAASRLRIMAVQRWAWCSSAGPQDLANWLLKSLHTHTKTHQQQVLKAHAHSPCIVVLIK